jgi:hydroxymethylpyrimidine pyrophosphatase-like HAD family hydrolase
MKKNKTIFCDIDGTLFKYRKFETYKSSTPEVLPGAKEKINEWLAAGHQVVLTTARPVEMRDHTIKELQAAGIGWSAGRLIMGIERGERYVINDMDPEKPGKRAFGINLPRDLGLAEPDWNVFDL